MSKNDLYNCKIKEEYIGLVNFTLIFVSVMLIILGSVLLLIALLYKNVDEAVQNVMFVVSGLSYAGGILYPLITIKLVRIYPKHKKAAHAFLKAYVFEDKPQPEV